MVNVFMNQQHVRVNIAKFRLHVKPKSKCRLQLYVKSKFSSVYSELNASHCV